MTISSIGNVVAASVRLPAPHVAAQTAPAVSDIAPAATTPPPEAAHLSQAVASINQAMQKMGSGLEFSIDQESQRTIVKIVDQQTKELIRQMPSAETLEIAKALNRVQGLLISLRA